MTSTIKKTIFISLFWHVAIFNIFSFTFGDRITRGDFAQVLFLGPILSKQDLQGRFFDISRIKETFNTSLKILPLNEPHREYAQVFRQYLKPPVFLPFNQEKITFITKTPPPSFRQKRTESVVMLYPPLPYHFAIYFKDRQSVHIELMLKLAPNGKTGTVMVKRKVSSGNLEADLLGMRYISHYLFVQQRGFPLDNWQTVKIDLSARDD